MTSKGLRDLFSAAFAASLAACGGGASAPTSATTPPASSSPQTDDPLWKRTMKFAYLAGPAAMTVALAACGGGGGGGGGTQSTVPPLSACAVSVATGFSGDLNATYSDNSGGDGGAGGAGDGGGAGAGGGEGKVMGGLMTVTRLADGVVLGSATTDATTGLVSIKPCAADGALMLTLSGQAGATYYDEGLGTTAAFPQGTVLHALVDQFDENVGVSALTEAAYRYALNNFIGNPSEIAAGQAPLMQTGNLTGLTAAQVRAANAVVLAEVNRFLPTASQLSSIKALPTPLDSSSSTTTLSNNSYGLNAVATGGLAKLAALYFPGGTSPALSMTDQLARDLTDGKIDGFALDGSAVVNTGTNTTATYYSNDLSPRLQATSYAISAQFGANSTYNLGAGYSDFEYADVYSSNATSVCDQMRNWAALAKDGTVVLIRSELQDVNSPCSATNQSVSSSIKGYVSNVQALEGNLSNSFALKYDGSLVGWGTQYCGELGNGESSGIIDTPSQVVGLSAITSIGLSNFGGIARDSQGRVYTWGSDTYGLLGLGSNPAYDLAVCDYANGFPGNDVPNVQFAGAVTTPRQVPGLPSILSVTASQLMVAALDVQGNVWMWGLSPSLDPSQPSGASASTPTKVAGLSSVVQISGSSDALFALRQDGTVWALGENSLGAIGTGNKTPVITPVQLPGLSNIVAVAGNQLAMAALDSAGAVYVWDAGLFPTPTPLTSISTCEVPDPTSGACENTLLQTNLPSIQRIKSGGNFIGFEDFNGTIYLFYPSAVGEQMSNALFLRYVTASSFGL